MPARACGRIFVNDNKSNMINPLVRRIYVPILNIWMSPLSIVGATGLIFSFISFFDEFPVSKQNNPRWDVLWRHIWGYSVCLCPIKMTAGLYGLNEQLMH